VVLQDCLAIPVGLVQERLVQELVAELLDYWVERVGRVLELSERVPVEAVRCWETLEGGISGLVCKGLEERLPVLEVRVGLAGRVVLVGRERAQQCRTWVR
jgi:hypothetical protein